jgi:asparagine synthase (glutamine-hydrolysing)
MCGITGFIDFSHSMPSDRLGHIVGGMSDALAHRGPDSSGVWVDPRHGFAMGHRRLSIRDLSPAGSQPMLTENGRFVIAYNGEIYNADELGEELRQKHGIVFSGTSDTEVLLYGCALEGVERFVKKCIGMFAFALWDRSEGKLTLARDRFGIKPLYCGRANGCFVFASELKAIERHPSWQSAISRSAIAQLMRFGYILAPNCIYENICKVLPGHILIVDFLGSRQDACFWDCREKILEGQSRPYPADGNEAVENLHSLLKDAVRRRFVSDVPLGAFLSGGIDSSLIVALMQAQSTDKIRTFSIGFEESGYNEAFFAKAVAAHIGTEHTELCMTAGDALEIIPLLPTLYDEPFADSSQLAVCLLSRFVRQHVTVALSGDGGDELFAGYDHYFVHSGENSILPPLFWKTAHDFVLRTPASFWKSLGRFAPKRHRADFYRKLQIFLLRNTLRGVARYKHQTSNWRQPERIVKFASEPPHPCDGSDFWDKVGAYIEKMQAMDSMTYLPDDILVKVDRAGMAFSLEVRVPMLDHRVFEESWRLPLKYKVRGRVRKWILREILRHYVPDKLIERPKMGFGVPIDVWLRGPLRDWAEDLLNANRMRQEGWLEPEPVRQHWQRHLAGENLCYMLWNVLMFQAWLRNKKPVQVWSAAG